MGLLGALPPRGGRGDKGEEEDTRGSAERLPSISSTVLFSGMLRKLARWDDVVAPGRGSWAVVCGAGDRLPTLLRRLPLLPPNAPRRSLRSVSSENSSSMPPMSTSWARAGFVDGDDAVPAAPAPCAAREMMELRVLHSLRSVIGVRLGSRNLPRPLLCRRFMPPQTV